MLGSHAHLVGEHCAGRESRLRYTFHDSPWTGMKYRDFADRSFLIVGLSISIACYLTPPQSAFRQLSPIVQVKYSTAPLLLCAQNADTLRSGQHLGEIRKAEKNSMHVTFTASAEFQNANE